MLIERNALNFKKAFETALAHIMKEQRSRFIEGETEFYPTQVKFDDEVIVMIVSEMMNDVHFRLELIQGYNGTFKICEFEKVKFNCFVV